MLIDIRCLAVKYPSATDGRSRWGFLGEPDAAVIDESSGSRDIETWRSSPSCCTNGVQNSQKKNPISEKAIVVLLPRENIIRESLEDWDA